MDSKALRLGMACVALLGLAACGNNNRPMIMVMDGGGGGTDSGTMTGTDAGTPRPDSGMMGGMCAATITMTSWPPLPAACLPRCSTATLNAINMCPATDGGTCVNAALEADTTATIPWTLNGMAQDTPLDCPACFGFQQFSCAFASCPDQTIAYIGCDETMDADMCMGEVTAVNDCLMANQAAFQSCANTQIGACFPAGGSGFFPGIEPAYVGATLPWSSIDPSTIDMFRAARGL